MTREKKSKSFQAMVDFVEKYYVANFSTFEELL